MSISARAIPTSSSVSLRAVSTASTSPGSTLPPENSLTRMDRKILRPFGQRTVGPKSWVAIGTSTAAGRVFSGTAMPGLRS